MAELEQVEPIVDPIGARLKSAREAQGMHLDDVAAKTRVPIRHLLHIEKGEWDQLPAPTYSVGFARAYATAVGLDASEIGAELRAQLSSAQTPTPSYYEPADPARVPPRWLAILAALVAILLIAGYLVWRSDLLGGTEEPAAPSQPSAAAEGTPQSAPDEAQAPPAAAPAATGPVVLTATNDVWLRVYEAGGTKLYENTMRAGERYEVPASANHPLLLTGRPNALQVTVGTTQIPPLGPPEKSIADVSLLPADLLAHNSAPAAGPAMSVAPAAKSAPPPQPRRTTPPPAATKSSPPPAPAAAADTPPPAATTQ